MTNEPDSLVDKAIDAKRMRFPVAMVDTEEESVWGVRGFPTSVLVDVDGTILWRGHPAAFDEAFPAERLEELLARTSGLPALPEEFADVVERALEKKDYGSAYDKLASKLARDPENAALAAWTAAVEERVAASLAKASAATERGEFGRAAEIYEELLEDYDDVPRVDEAKDALADLKRNRDAKDELSAMSKWTKAMEKWREGDLERALKSLESLADKYPTTTAGRRALEIVARHED